MKKKIVNVFLIAALLVTAVGTFVSCKDTNEDDFSTLQGQFNTQLEALEDALEQAIAEQTEALEAAQEELQGQIDDLQSQINALETEIGELEDEIEGKIEEINTKIEEIDQCECDPTTTDETIETLQDDLETLESELEELQEDYIEKSATLASLEEDLASANTAITTINTTLTGLTETTDSLAGVTDSLEQRVAANEDNITYLLSEITRLDSISIIVEALTGIETRVTTLETEVGGLRDSLVTLWAQVYQDSAYIASLQTSVATLDSLYADLKSSYDDLESRYEADSAAVWDSLAVLSNRCDTLSTYIDTQIATVYSYIDTEIEELQAALEQAIADGDSVTLEKAQAYTDSIESLLQDSIDALAVIVSDLSEQVAANTTAIQELTDRVSTLETEVLARYVTSIIVQGTENGCFGSFALPLGITSKILMGYYGVYEPTSGTFPTISSASAYNGKAYLSDEQWAILTEAGISTESIDQGDRLAIFNDEGDIEAGTIYLTVNPTSVDFTDLTVSLENSQGEESGVKLSALEPSDALLTFGYTRSTDNGFYEAEASIAESEIDNVKIDITSGLKSELASTLKSVVNNDAINFTSLISLVYDQFNGILDANAVKTAWEDTTGTEYSVYSEYGVAATAFKPLSFKFLGNVNYSIPTINTLSYIDLGDFDELNIELEGVNIEYTYEDVELEITFSTVEFEINDVDTIIKLVYEHPITSEDTLTDVNGNDSIVRYYNVNEDGTMEVTSDTLTYSLNDFVVALQNSIEEMLDSLQNDINTQLNDEVNTLLEETVNDIIAQINAEVNSMIDNINEQLSSINDLIDSFNGIQETLDSYIDKVNNYITRVNSVINRVNSYLTKANDYLQVALTYEGSSGQGLLSNDLTWYNTMSAGSTAVLHPTTYTGELAVPAVKKYVAVTNVYSGVTDTTGALEDADLKALMIEANQNSTLFNEVLDGNIRAVGFTIPSSAKSGQIFEITYAALDYNGYTSYNTYYIGVK